MSIKVNTQIFVKRSNSIHNNKYNYSESIYINNRTKIQIICNIHGLFEQRPDHHLNGRGCAKCGGSAKSNLSDFINKSNKIHHHKYDYSLMNYIDAITVGKIICKTHGIFYQDPHRHLSGRGCPKCGMANKSDNLSIFINKAKNIHLDKYDYSESIYINTNTKLKIICNIHGLFQQAPGKHLQGRGCPLCCNKNETKLNEYLKQNNIVFKAEYLLPLNKIIKIDFFVPGLNLFIEYNGHQHYHPVRFGNITENRANKKFEKQKIRDQFVRQYCIQNNINLLEIDGRKYYGSILEIYLKNDFINYLYNLKTNGYNVIF